MAYKKKNGKTGFIYTLSEPIPENDPNSSEWMVRYVGQTTSFTERYSWSGVKLHLSDPNDPDIKLMKTSREVDRWIKNLLRAGIEPKMDLAEEVPNDKQSLDDAEHKWFLYWSERVPKPLLNADDCRGNHGIPNERTKKKMSESQKLRTKLGLRKPSEKRTKIVLEKAQISERDYEQQNFYNANKPIIQCDQEGNEICEWSSVNLAAKELGLAPQNIRRSCKVSASGNSKPSFCGGCIWKWKYPNDPSKNFQKNIILQFGLDGKLIREWETLSLIEKETGFLRQPISGCCKSFVKFPDQNHTSYGFIWKYKNPELRHSQKRVIVSKKVNQYDFSDNLIKTWKNPTTIERELEGFSKVQITACCNGNEKRPHKNYTHHGFIWRWAAEKDNKN